MESLAHAIDNTCTLCCPIKYKTLSVTDVPPCLYALVGEIKFISLFTKFMDNERNNIKNLKMATLFYALLSR